MSRSYLSVAVFALGLSAGCASMEGARQVSGDPLSPLTAEAQREFDATRSDQRPSAGRRVILYIPDRLMDALDVVTFGLGAGYGFDVDRHATYFLHVPTLGWYKSFNFLNWNYKRNLCYAVNEETEMGFLPFYSYSSKFSGKGTGWDSGAPGSGEKEYAKKGGISPQDPIYKEGYRDPWALGVAYGPVLLSPRVEVDLHPVEVADLIVGLVTFGFVDLSSDDYAVK